MQTGNNSGDEPVEAKKSGLNTKPGFRFSTRHLFVLISAFGVALGVFGLLPDSLSEEFSPIALVVFAVLAMVVMLASIPLVALIIILMTSRNRSLDKDTIRSHSTFNWIEWSLLGLIACIAILAALFFLATM